VGRPHPNSFQKENSRVGIAHPIFFRVGSCPPSPTSAGAHACADCPSF